MKKVTNQTRIIMSILLIAALAVTAVPIHSLAKAKVKLNKTKLSMNVGKTATLKLKNNKKKVKWSSSNKKVAKVSAKGKVKGLKKGKATITAKVGKKKYKCEVTVKARKEAKATKKPVPAPRPTAAATENPTARPTEIPIASPDTTPTATPTQEPTKTPVPKLESISFEKEEIEAIPVKNTIAELIPYPSINADIRDDGGKIITWECDSEYVKIENWWTSDAYLKVRIEPQAGFVGTATITAKVLDFVASIRVNVPEVGAELKLSEDGTKVLECPNDHYVTYINLPDSVTTLGEWCFRYCRQIKTWEIPSSVTTIEEGALPINIESVYIPPSVTYIEYQHLIELPVYGESGSYAEQWAKENHHIFIPR